MKGECLRETGIADVDQPRSDRQLRRERHHCVPQYKRLLKFALSLAIIVQHERKIHELAAAFRGQPDLTLGAREIGQIVGGGRSLP